MNYSHDDKLELFHHKSRRCDDWTRQRSFPSVVLHTISFEYLNEVVQLLYHYRYGLSTVNVWAGVRRKHLCVVSKRGGVRHGVCLPFRCAWKRSCHCRWRCFIGRRDGDGRAPWPWVGNRRRPACVSSAPVG